MPSDELLDRYAEVAIHVGLGLRPGDRLLVESHVALPDLTRRLVEAAYEVGAVNVDVLWSDDATDRARFSHGSDEAVDTVADSTEFRRAAYASGTASLRILAEDPEALAGVDVARVQRFRTRNQARLMPAYEDFLAGRVPWTVIAAPVPAWTGSVFPDDDDATERLWQAILRACRIDTADPVAAWRAHGAELAARRDHLTSRHYAALRYEGPGTDLRVELPDGARWAGGPVGDLDGRTFVPNLPTEEVFTVPHRLRAQGHIRASKPLSWFGNLVEGFAFEVVDGKVVAATAERGGAVLDHVLATDDGSARFGELAMVPQSSAVAAEGLVWNNMLYDENDACHIALGKSYPVCVDGGPDMTAEERLAVGLNDSSVHVDFVVGSQDLDVFGVCADGGEEPIIAAGEWGFDV